jgi:hypothetical protein
MFGTLNSVTSLHSKGTPTCPPQKIKKPVMYDPLITEDVFFRFETVIISHACYKSGRFLGVGKFSHFRPGTGCC